MSAKEKENYSLLTAKFPEYCMVAFLEIELAVRVIFGSEDLL